MITTLDPRGSSPTGYALASLGLELMMLNPLRSQARSALICCNQKPVIFGYHGSGGRVGLFIGNALLGTLIGN